VLLAVVAVTVLSISHLWLTRQDFGLHRDRVLWCLAGLTAWTWFQTVPLPECVVAALNPQAVEWHRSLRPAHGEIVPGDPRDAVSIRSWWLPLSVAPLDSQRLAGQFAAVTLLYAAGRLVAGRGSWLYGLAWTGCVLGLLLSLAGVIQYLAGERERIYGRFVTDSPAFGPFVNKNHFAFQVEVLVGLGVGLWLTEWRRLGWRSATTVGSFFALGLMLTALVLSQCRGGLLAVAMSLAVTGVLAWPRLPSRRGLIGGVLLLLVAAAGGLIWLGNDAVFSRLATLGRPEADNRTPLWREIWHLVERFSLTGAGGGAYTIVELVTRTRFRGPVISTTAHNEYLEAWIEGGLPRLGLTLLLVVWALRYAGRAYRLRQDHLDLGVLFALCTVAIHSFGDAGIHVPSVALATVIVAVAAGARHRHEPAAPLSGLRKPAIIVGALVVLMLAALWPSIRDYRADRWQRRAFAAPTLAQAVDCLEHAVAWQPRDFELWEQLAALHLLRAVTAQRSVHSALAGPLVELMPSDLFIPAQTQESVLAAIRASRAARDAQPLWPGPHLRLAALTRHCQQADSLECYLARAQLVGAADADVWFTCGQIWATCGNWEHAFACWRQSLLRSSKHLAAIARWLAWGPMPPEQSRQQCLPDDPLLWYEVARILFASSRHTAASRQWYSDVAQRFAQQQDLTEPAAYRVWAESLIYCERYEEALSVLERGVQRFPNDQRLRELLADSLDQAERFAEALAQWQQLVEQYPHVGQYRWRQAAAQRALELQQVIDRYTNR
jgi:O-antigen ligase/tetratricopeptide (TPR) repeat protein